MRTQNATFFILTIFALLLPLVVLGRHVSTARLDHKHMHGPRWMRAMGRAADWGRRKGRTDTMQVAGSRLPDCSHACGSCFPCRLAMVSFVCADLEEAETCPMAYKCVCKSKSYPVP